MSMNQNYASAQLNAYNASQSYANTAIEPCQPPCLMSEIHGKLETLNMLITDAGGDLTVLSDRMFGPVPRNIPGVASGNAAKPNGQASELMETINLLIDRASAVRDEARTLNSRI